MPPKPKCTRESIAAAALAMVKEQGLAALTARELGKRLGTSSSPIFTVYDSMDEVRISARKIALADFRKSVLRCDANPHIFLNICIEMANYSRQQPDLFKLLFLQEIPAKQDSIPDAFGDLPALCISALAQEYTLSDSQSLQVWEQLWAHAYGLCVMCTMNLCTLSDADILSRFRQCLDAQIARMRS